MGNDWPTIIVPPCVHGDLDGFQFMAKCLNRVRAARENIIFDFAENRHFDPSLTAALGMIVKIANEQDVGCALRNVSMKIKKIWERNGFLSYFIKFHAIERGRTKKKDVERYLEVHKGRLHDAADYIENEFLSADECPKMSENLRKEMMRSILELIGNAHEHGGKNYAMLCGHTSHEDGKMCFCVTNIGRTFKKNISEFLPNGLPSEYCNHIDWATNGNTTKKETGGLGLRLLREFMEKNNGRIHICSDTEYWVQNESGYISHDNLSEALRGTVVYLEINIQDKKTYSLTRERHSEHKGG